jgi:HlyD family secretion protein
MDRPLLAAGRWTRTQLVAAALVAGLLVAILILLPSLRRWFRADKAVDSTTVRFATVTQGDLLRDVAVQGKVVAALHPTLFAGAQGVVSLRTKAGAQVAKGDVLAVIESPELRSQLAQAQSQLASLRADAERQKLVARQTDARNRQQVDLLAVRLDAAKRALDRTARSFEQGVGTRADLEAAQDTVHVATMEHAQAVQAVGLEHETMAFDVASRVAAADRQQTSANELQQKFNDQTIRAPFDGMVASVNVQDRDAVVPNAAILMLVNLSSYEVEIALPEEYAGDTKIGMPATIDSGGHVYDGVLTAVSPEVVNSQVTATVAFRGTAPEGLKQSQRLTARLVFESKKNVLKVARGAWFETGGGRHVYVVENGSASRREITTGAATVSEVEITHGLKPGETIVVSDTTTFDNANTVMLR